MDQLLEFYQDQNVTKKNVLNCKEKVNICKHSLNSHHNTVGWGILPVHHPLSGDLEL